jgi:hypothetical protein
VPAGGELLDDRAADAAGGSENGDAHGSCLR